MVCKISKVFLQSISIECTGSVSIANSLAILSALGGYHVQGMELVPLHLSTTSKTVILSGAIFNSLSSYIMVFGTFTDILNCIHINIVFFS